MPPKECNFIILFVFSDCDSSCWTAAGLVGGELLTGCAHVFYSQ